MDIYRFLICFTLGYVSTTILLSIIVPRVIQKIKEKREWFKMNKDMQNRFKSPVLWSSIITALLLLLGEWNLYDILGIKEELARHTFDFILLVLTLFGVINNPNNKSEI